MRKELEDILFETAPTFYSEKGLDPTETCMCYGFECEDGWFEPLLDFSRMVEQINGLAIKCHFCFVASLVKQKFSDIRVYWHTKPCSGMYDENPDDAEIKTLHSMMEDACSVLTERYRHTCEKCGSTVNIVTTSCWMQHLCEKCSRQLNGKRQGN